MTSQPVSSIFLCSQFAGAQISQSFCNPFFSANALNVMPLQRYALLACRIPRVTVEQDWVTGREKVVSWISDGCADSVVAACS